MFKTIIKYVLIRISKIEWMQMIKSEIRFYDYPKF